LTPRYGIYGVAASAAISPMVGQFIGIMQYRPKFALKLLKGVITF
jgi:hypothetical protein